MHSGIVPATGEKCRPRVLHIFRLWGGSADASNAEEEMIKSIHFKRLVEPNGGKDEYPQAVPEKQTRVQGHFQHSGNAQKCSKIGDQSVAL
jgi:hypothetical protein